ncbi:MAG: hypothetical protein AAGA48_34815 [Myxococcota bacterium]
MWWVMAGAAVAQTPTEVGSVRPFGLGVQLGTFSGITGKLYLRGRETAFDFAVGTAYGATFADSVHAHVTFHQHFGPLTEGAGVTIPWRLGVGGWLNAGRYWVVPQFEGRGVIAGARLPVGLDFDLEDVPVQFYAEIAFALVIVPGITAGLDGSIGVRYYF